MKKRKILLVTGSRGEYGYIRPIIRLIEKYDDLEYEIVATNMHLLPEFGFTLKEIIDDGFRVRYRPTNTLSGFAPFTMMKSLCIFGLSFTDIVESAPFAIILLAGDRGEQLMAAIAGAHLNIPVAHIQAGELSGNIDGMTRHTIARFAHIHFASNLDAVCRLKKSGEEDFRIFNVGAPQLDDFLAGEFSTAEEISAKYSLDMTKPFILLVQHPVTEEFQKAGEQIEETLSAICEIGVQTIVIFPNSDAGSASILRAINKSRNPFIRVFRSLLRKDYGGLMAMASALVGNSSSGILEAPSFALPTVNIGRRQLGRLQGINVINCNYQRKEIEIAIRKALSSEFKESLRGMANPYGDGRASESIVQILRTIPIDERLLCKRLTY